MLRVTCNDIWRPFARARQPERIAVGFGESLIRVMGNRTKRCKSVGLFLFYPREVGMRTQIGLAILLCFAVVYSYGDAQVTRNSQASNAQPQNRCSLDFQI